MEYKVKVEKLNNTGTSYTPVKLSIVDEQVISDLLEKYFKK